ncbi:MAG: hypothetical protein Ta2A_13640 [Treponemataceae bacterium]|nr:MAG: hypothetical protein Ta2A_13640 [Treponemataceae bacterium]
MAKTVKQENQFVWLWGYMGQYHARIRRGLVFGLVLAALRWRAVFREVRTRQRGKVGRCARSRPGATTRGRVCYANSWAHGRAAVLASFFLL